MHVDCSFIAGIENVMTEFCFLELLKSRLDISMLGYYIISVRKDKRCRCGVSVFLCVSII